MTMYKMRDLSHQTFANFPTSARQLWSQSEWIHCSS